MDFATDPRLCSVMRPEGPSAEETRQEQERKFLLAVSLFG